MYRAARALFCEAVSLVQAQSKSCCAQQTPDRQFGSIFVSRPLFCIRSTLLLVDVIAPYSPAYKATHCHSLCPCNTVSQWMALILAYQRTVVILSFFDIAPIHLGRSGCIPTPPIPRCSPHAHYTRWSSMELPLFDSLYTYLGGSIFLSYTTFVIVHVLGSPKLVNTCNSSLVCILNRIRRPKSANVCL